MREHELNAAELTALVRRVFHPRPEERALAILVDLPDQASPDEPAWRQRRQLAAGWAEQLAAASAEHGLEVALYLYRNVRTNNADLPARSGPARAAARCPTRPRRSRRRGGGRSRRCSPATRCCSPPTELSATAPLKVAGRDASPSAPPPCPASSPEMIPALRLDYDEVNRRVDVLKGLLDRAEEARTAFRRRRRRAARPHLDLRHRTAHASGGLLLEPGTAGNLPSGRGLHRPLRGRACGRPEPLARACCRCSSATRWWCYADRGQPRRGGAARRSRVARARPRCSAAEPAYGNLAELGLGVLAELRRRADRRGPARREARPAHRLRPQRPLRRPGRPRATSAAPRRSSTTTTSTSSACSRGWWRRSTSCSTTGPASS